MAILSTTAQIVHRTRIPASVSKEVAVAQLQDHDFFLQCDPHLKDYKSLPSPAAGSSSPASQHPNVPAAVAEVLRGGAGAGSRVVKVYEMTDDVPNPVWSSTVISVQEVVDHTTGVFTRVASPMAVKMETTWEVREVADDDGKGGLELVEDMFVSCSRMLITLVKNQVEANVRGIHDRIIAKMVEAATAGAGTTAE
ncbi:hypothetical protein BX600DRAFT_171298 [Xylariales sp. PMI_506]|nr:hypothetical protein BX600DRAFT_171298 [Xylariales sp. PMI_506]